jgi:hypothetical protein
MTNCPEKRRFLLFGDVFIYFEDSIPEDSDFKTFI